MLSADEFAVLDTERPYSLDMTDGARTIWMQFPRTELLSRTSIVRPLLARPLPGRSGAGAVFVHLARELTARMGELNASDKPVMGAFGLDVFALAVSSSLNAKTSYSSSQALALNRIKLQIERHLRDADLTPSRAAALYGVSVRHANRLLATQNMSLGRYIWMRRLEGCKSALEDRALSHMTISEIAYAWGFNDPSHFARAFRARFGIPPSDFRKVRC